MTNSNTNKPNFKSLPYDIDPKLLDQPIEQHIASELVASPFLKFCYKCGAAITFRPNKKKGNGPHWLKMEYLEPGREHVCDTKKRSIAEIVIEQDEKEQATP
jgi:hypothetical protein